MKKTYTIKHMLTDDEFYNFVTKCMNSLFDPDINIDVPYYITKPLVIPKLIVEYYTDIDNIDTVENFYTLIDEIKENINLSQYQDLMDSIDEGIKYELHKSNPESKLNQLLDTILAFSEGLPSNANALTDLVKSADKEKIDRVFEIFGNVVTKEDLQ